MDIVTKVEKLVRGVVEGLSLELVDLELSGMGKKQMLRVYIHKKGGVSLEDCAKVTRALNPVLDAESPIEHSYTLEVSSPGLDRPLKRPADFTRNIGQWIQLTLREAVNGKKQVTAQLKTVTNKECELVDRNKTYTVSFDNILSAKVDIRF